jgi:hypothetical protein
MLGTLVRWVGVVAVALLPGCAMLQPHHITIHAIHSAPSPHAQPGAGGNFKAAVETGADVARVVLTKDCTLCIVAGLLRDMFGNVSGVGADLVEGHKTNATRVAVPLPEGQTVTVRLCIRPDGVVEAEVTPTPLARGAGAAP